MGPSNKEFRHIINEIGRIRARREELTLGAFDALACSHPVLAQALLDQIGGERRVAHWLCAPQRAWDGRSPCELLADGDEDGVWDLLEGVDSVDPTDQRHHSQLAG